jgi:beta-lactamase regulating signal transducer with metallopeptidase domain
MDHPIGHRLGWALVHSIWQGAAVAAVFSVARLALRHASANARYLSSCVALFSLVAAPVVTFFCAPIASPSIPQPSPLISHTLNRELGVRLTTPMRPLGMRTAGPQYLSRSGEFLDQALPWVLQFWVLGVLAFSCRWFHGSRWIRHIRSNDTEPLDQEWTSRLRILSQKLDILRPVRLFKSALVDVPLVIGWLRPVILLPASALSGLTPDQLEAILAHELAHVKRCDFIVNASQNLVETLMFYHPAVWWISQCIREEREQCCDDLVVHACGDRVTYARALLILEEARGFPRLAFAASGGSLLHRVRRLLGFSNEVSPPSAAEFSGITLVAVGFVLIIAAGYLLSYPAVYQATALIRLNTTVAQQTAATGTEGPGGGVYNPYLLQTECLVIRSPVVLERVINSIKLKESSTNVPGAKINALARLRTRLGLRPLPGTSVIEIQVSDSEPAEAARIANAVAVAYRDHREENRRKSLSSSLETLETRFVDYNQKVHRAQQAVDKLRAELNLPDAVFSENENMPAVLLSAETLRHIEALRIETQAEYVKQKTLLERLDHLDPGDLPATIPAVGVQDNQLASLLESLALVEQRLVSLQKELGPEHTEVVKAVAQQQELKRKIEARTRGFLMGLQAKLESTAQGLDALSNAVARARESDVDLTSRSRPYFEAKRDLEDLVRFRQVLQTRIAMQRTDLQLPQQSVEIVEEAIAPTQAVTPNRPRALTLLSMGFLLALFGWLLARTGRPGIPILKPA